MPNQVRRVVTGHDSSGKAIVLIDDTAPNASPRSAAGTQSWRIWVNDTPADMTGERDRGATPTGIAPPALGAVFRVVEFPPETEETRKLANDHFSHAIGADHHAPAKVRPPRHPMMHRTRTIDYGVVISGEITMLLDDSEVQFKAGDVFVQQATNHAWVNRGSEVCRIAFVLIDGKEPVE